MKGCRRAKERDILKLLQGDPQIADAKSTFLAAKIDVPSLYSMRRNLSSLLMELLGVFLRSLLTNSILEGVIPSLF